MLDPAPVSLLSLADGEVRILERPLLEGVTTPQLLVGGFVTINNGQLSMRDPTLPLVSLTGGTHYVALFPGTAMFDFQGPATRVQAGGLLHASGARISGEQAVRLVDRALLEATAPLIKLVAGSTMTSNSDLVKLVQNARLTGTVPSDALVMLNASALNVNGSLFNVAGGSSLNVTGNLVSLTNGSTLTLTNGALVSVSGGSAFNLTGSFGSFGTGTNAITLPTTDVFGGHAHTINTSLIPGYGVALGNGAASSQVTVGGGFTPFTGTGGTNTVTPGGIVLHVDDTSHAVLR